MSEVEFIGRVNPKPLKSMDQQFKEERDQLLADQKRFAKYGTNNPKLAAFLASGQVIPAVELVRTREEEAKRSLGFEEAVQSEQALGCTRIPRQKVKSTPIFSREPF